MDAYANETADLTLSLDVIYHLIEDNVFFTYMDRLFDSSTKFVIIYSLNTDRQAQIKGKKSGKKFLSGPILWAIESTVLFD